MMDDLNFHCYETDRDTVTIEDQELGQISITVRENGNISCVFICKENAEMLREWLTEYLR